MPKLILLDKSGNVVIPIAPQALEEKQKLLMLYKQTCS